MQKHDYDFILLDCTPSLGMLTVNALAAADTTLIPVQAQYLSAKGLEQLLQRMERFFMERLKYIVEDSTIAELLGVQNFTNKESAILELVKNAYDAQANNVSITFSDQ